ncbi:MAG: hypothetical protein DWQ04_19235 [Chloroflexi bacterium]|nr:MAG: hypothetical protein DWQ04_19235 [Chloroflexota bacterium]
MTNKLANHLKKITAILILILFFVSIKILILMRPPKTSPRQIKSMESFEINWARSVDSSPLKIDNWEMRDTQIFIHIQDNQIILPILIKNTPFLPKETITSFDLNTGEIEWQTDMSFWYPPTMIGNNSDTIVVIVEGLEKPQESVNLCKPNLTRCENIKVTAIDAKTGNITWSLIYANIMFVDRLYVDEEIISIDGHAYRSSYHSELKLDVQNGWRIPEAQFGPSTIINDNQYKALNSHFGFERGDIVSNIADNGRFVFFLTKKDNTLFVVDKNSFIKVGEIKFTGEPFSQISNNRLQGFGVATSGENVIVYMSDSDQLFSFRFSQN